MKLYRFAVVLSAVGIIAATMPTFARDYNPRNLNEVTSNRGGYDRGHRGGYNRDIVRSDAYRDQRYDYMYERGLDQQQLQQDLSDNRRLFEQNRIDRDEYEKRREDLRDDYRDLREDSTDLYRNQRQERGQYKSKSSWQ